MNRLEELSKHCRECETYSCDHTQGWCVACKLNPSKQRPSRCGGSGEGYQGLRRCVAKDHECPWWAGINKNICCAPFSCVKQNPIRGGL